MSTHENHEGEQVDIGVPTTDIDALLTEVERLRKEISASKFFAEQRGLGKDHKFFMELIHTRPGKINEQDIKWAMDQIIEPQEPKND